MECTTIGARAVQRMHEILKPSQLISQHRQSLLCKIMGLTFSHEPEHAGKVNTCMFSPSDLP